MLKLESANCFETYNYQKTNTGLNGANNEAEGADDPGNGTEHCVLKHINYVLCNYNLPSLFRLTLNTGPRQSRAPEQVSMVSTYLMTLRLVMTRVSPSWMMPRSITTDLRGIPHREVNQGLSRHILNHSPRL